MKHSTHPNPSRETHNSNHKPFPVRKAALFLASALSGCGPAAVQPTTNTSGHADMVLVAPGDAHGDLMERFAEIVENAGRHRVYPDGREGSFGSVAGGWTFRRIDSESSETGRYATYGIIPNRELMGSAGAEPVTRIMTVPSMNPNFNVILQRSEYTEAVGSDVFILAIRAMAVFRFFSPETGRYEVRDVQLPEEGSTAVPAGAITSVVYKPEEKMIEVYYISSEKAVVVQFSLLTTNTTARPLE